MLVLSRKAQQAVVINGDIRITVLSIEGSRVRIGIEAPKHIPVLREELEMMVTSAPLCDGTVGAALH
jgi:carbon storage regulator